MNTKKTIYLIRHGETDYNKNGIIQGSGVDSDLNAKGYAQALKFFQAYYHVPFNNIYTSELKRAIQSINPFITAGFQHQALSQLNEISWGNLEGQINTPDNKRIYHGMVMDWKAGLLDRAVEGGESPNKMYKRQQQGLKFIMKQKHEEQVLICMHGRSMRSFLCLLTGSPLSQMDEFKHSNLCLYILKENGTYFDIVEANSVEHLMI